MIPADLLFPGSHKAALKLSSGLLFSITVVKAKQAQARILTPMCTFHPFFRIAYGLTQDLVASTDAYYGRPVLCSLTDGFDRPVLSSHFMSPIVFLGPLGSLSYPDPHLGRLPDVSPPICPSDCSKALSIREIGHMKWGSFITAISNLWGADMSNSSTEAVFIIYMKVHVRDNLGDRTCRHLLKHP